MEKRTAWSELIELIGLILLLTAAAWQIFFTDWWDSTADSWHSTIGRQIQQDTLHIIGEIGPLVAENNDEKRWDRANKIQTEAGKAVVAAVAEKERREKALNGQAHAFNIIRIGLFIIGSILMIIGKAMRVRVKHN